MKKISKIFFILSIFCLLGSLIFAELNDFDLSNAAINTGEFLSGGPGKDGIPAISNPKFIKGDKAVFLNNNDLVVGMVIDDIAKAYPLKILNWHEIINDTINEKYFSISWCPLTKSVIAFNRKIQGQVCEFGVSGLLYNSNLVMYDKNSNGLWPQLKTKAVTGRFASTDLSLLPSMVTTWNEWLSGHPGTFVLSENTGYSRRYNYDPYSSYHKSPEVMFPLKGIDKRLLPKDIVIGIKLKNTAKAYPLESLAKMKLPVSDIIDGINIKIHNGPLNTAYITDENENLLPATVMYWFAWSSFHKKTLLFNR